jgi:hypothetical protein
MAFMPQSPDRRFRFGGAVKGGAEVGSRVRVATAACLLASGLIVGGAGGALAFADPASDAVGIDEGDETTADTGEKDADVRKPDEGKPDVRKPEDLKTDGQEADDGKPDEPKPGGEKPDDGEPAPATETKPSETTDAPPPPDKEAEPGRCDEKGDDCGVSWPWWPRPLPKPGLPLEPGGGGSRGGVEVPSGRPELPPPMRLPAELLPQTERSEPAVIDAQPGVGIAASEIPLAPITLPIIVAPPAGFGVGGGAPRSVPTEPLPASPRGSAAEPPAGRQPPPGETGSNVTVPPSSYRVGYTDYLRSAGISQVVALAAPGLAGMLVLTGAGGLLGYRQAKAGHAVRTGSTARFVN